MKRFPQSLPETDDPHFLDALSHVEAEAAREERIAQRVADIVVERLQPAVRPFNMLTIDEACRFFSVSRDTLTNWEREGLLIPFRAGKVILYDTRAVDAFVRQQSEPADQAAAA